MAKAGQQIDIGCEAREISMVELARRGIEYILSGYATDSKAEWQSPTPRRLGRKELSESELKDLAQLTSREISASSATGRRRKS